LQIDKSFHEVINENRKRIRAAESGAKAAIDLAINSRNYFIRLRYAVVFANCSEANRVGAVMLFLCVIDFAIVIPIAIKLGKIKKQIIEITENNPQ